MASEALSPIPSDPTASFSDAAHHSADNSFPIIAVAVIGILATAFLLLTYYVFVIKCCLNWHRLDLLRRRHTRPLIPEFHAAEESRGLDESAIRTIPIFRYKNGDGRSFCECAVCLTEFQEEEKLRFIPNCSHAFHIDCIDVWLQNNANCPLCRTSVSATPLHTRQPLTPLFGNPSLYDENFTGNDEDYVIIDLPGRHSVSMDQSLLKADAERSSSSSSNHPQAEVAPLKPEPRLGFKKQRTKLPPQCSSKGDECIDIRSKDDKFDGVQPMRRSFSMGSKDDQQLYLMVQEMGRQQSINQNNDGSEGCSNSSKLRRSFFSLGSGRGSKSSVLPIHSEL
uniref:RING-type E3 ubiquitin transferase n=1 Tax=Kalanchoe fedtschenkoi TaxID=63787 RepID=A0A7N0UEG6_KALFE